MNETTNTTISEVFLDVVEQLAFMFGDPCDGEEMPCDRGPWARASIRFESEVSGVISLAVPQELCPEIAANIIGVDPEDVQDPAVAHDSLKEMLNVVCGHVVPVLQPEGADFVLAIPELETLTAEECGGVPETDTVTCFNLDGSPVLLALRVDG